ncbi:MAG: prolipoprotein diacylglyceryl transferase [Candidatus Metalachnospira sp.]|nr:prolipoprotein diacylglyceryl transferase [Candidatus Metalachnospira sp.]
MPDIWFPNLGIKIDSLNRVAFSLFGLEVYWYGILIGGGIVLSTYMAMRYMKKIGGNPEDVSDFILYAIIFCIIGARLYYVAFEWDLYKDNLLDIFNTRQGGLAIYGGIIAAAIFGIFYTRKRNLDFWGFADIVAPSISLGQAIGRLGNFFNREAFGGYTDSLFAMRYKLEQVSQSNLSDELLNNIVTVDQTKYIQVHPTFLYEALWNVGVIIILILIRKSGKLKRRIFPMYIILYGIGRAWIEGLRTDSLYLWDSPIRVSQALSVLLIIVGIVLLFIIKADGGKGKKYGSDYQSEIIQKI